MSPFSSRPTTEKTRRASAALPKVFCQDNADNRALVAAIEPLHKPFRPTPWLFNEHLQLVHMSMRTKRPVLPYDRTEPFVLPDSGETAIYFRGYDLPASTPTIVLLPTIAGSPLSMGEFSLDLHRMTGFRVALLLRRGHGDLKLATPRIHLLGSTDDLRLQLDVIRSRFPESPLLAVGSSAGSGLLVRYLGEEGERSPFVSAFAYCPGYDTDVIFEKTHPFYSRYMTKTLLDQFVRPNERIIAELETATRLSTARRLSEFHQAAYELSGYSSYEDYSQGTNPIRVFDSVKTPMMLLNSEDDPVCRIEMVEPHLETIERLARVVLVTTARGSHCAHYEGLRPRSWATKLIASYLRASLIFRAS